MMMARLRDSLDYFILMLPTLIPILLLNCMFHIPNKQSENITLNIKDKTMVFCFEKFFSMKNNNDLFLQAIQDRQYINTSYSSMTIM